MPPPFQRTVYSIDDRPDIPGEIKLDQSGKLIKSVIEMEGVTQFLIDIYNNWITTVLPQQISSRTIRLPQGDVVFDRVYTIRPSQSIGGKSVAMYPADARNNKLAYSAEILIDLVLPADPSKGRLKEERIEKVSIGKIPVMLGSTLCYLHGMTDLEKIEIGECARDPMGYFVVNGLEKVVILQEKLRLNRIAISEIDKKGGVQARMTCPTIHGDRVVDVVVGPKRDLLLHLPFLGKSADGSRNTIGVFQVFRLMAQKYPREFESLANPDVMMGVVAQFSRPEWHRRLWQILQPSFLTLEAIGSDIEDINKKRRTQGVSNPDFILQSLENELFPQMNGEPVIRKVQMLAMMIAKLSEYLAGFRELDDRDSWGNKRLESAGRMMEQLFNGLWTKMITDVQDKVLEMKNPSLEQVRVRLIGNTITEGFSTSFTSTSWGVPNSYNKESITEILNRGSGLATISAMTKVSTPVSRQAKNPRIRMVSMSQLGFLCPAETPEGEGALSVDTLVLLTNGKEVPIGSLRLDSEVVTVHPTTHFRGKTQFMKYFKKMSSDLGLQMYRITLATGKTIKCTEDHPFLTQRGRVETRDLKETTDSLTVWDCETHATVPILSIETIPPEEVADFTTISNNHTFIANGIVTYNCGLIKNMAITCSLSVDRDETLIRQAITPYIFADPSPSATTRVLLNGKLLGWSIGEQLKAFALEQRRTARFYKDTMIVLDRDNQLMINTDSSRPIRPLLILDADGVPVIQKKNLWNSDIKTWLREGCVEYIDALEQEFLYIAQSLNDIGKRERDLQELTEQVAELEEFGDPSRRDELELAKSALVLQQAKPKFTHCEMDPTAILGIAASLIPFADRNQAPRNTFQCLGVHEKIQMADGSLREIGSLQNGDMVKTIDVNTMQVSETKIKNHFVVHTQESGKKVYRLKIGDHSIIATDDHKFWTIDGWREVQHFSSIQEVEAQFVSDFETESENHTFLTEHGWISHNCSMGKQALGIYHSNYLNRYDTSAKVLAMPTRPLFETQMNSILGLNDLPAGEMVIVAIMTYGGFNQEDSFIFNQASIDRGLFMMVKYTTHTEVESARKNDITEVFGRPEVKKNEPTGRYAALDDNGLPRPGAKIRAGDAIIGRIRTNVQTKQSENASVFAVEPGVIDSVLLTTNAEHNRVIKVRIRTVRSPIIGDKFASRSAQKGTIGLILPEEDMPYTREGIKPDIIINPHSIPSRMTIGKVLEIVMSKVAAIRGERANATAFRAFDLDDLKRNLTQYGYNANGNEVMYSGRTGKKLEAEIYTGPCYYQALRHHVLDKIQQRSQGIHDPLNRQPVGGRTSGQALRVGEQERDALIAFGATRVLTERLCDVSDRYKTVWCRNCGTIAISDAVTGEYQCRKCGKAGDFGTASVPYPFILMTRSLAAASINLSVKLTDQPRVPITRAKLDLEELDEAEELETAAEGLDLGGFNQMSDEF